MASKPLEGKGRGHGALDRPLPAHQIPEGWPRGAVSLSSPGANRPKPPRNQYWLPPFRGPPRLTVWSDPPRSSPSSPGQPSVRQSVPNSVHTQRLPAPAGSSSSAGQEVWPPPPHAHTHFLVSKWGGDRPVRGSARRGLWLAGLAAQSSTRDVRCRCLPPPTYDLSHLPGSVVCEAGKTGSVNPSRDVTASLQQRMG